MNKAVVDAFILFNEKEHDVVVLVEMLEAQGVSTYFWRRDIPLGTSWTDVEDQRLRDAGAVLVILGIHGWGPTHLEITEKAQALGKHIVPVLIGDPPEGATAEAEGMFAKLRYADLREEIRVTPELVAAIRAGDPARADQAAQFDGIIAELVDGNEADRARVLRLIRAWAPLTRMNLGRRLAFEIRNRFSPESETSFQESVRNPKLIPSIRSWMLNCLIWADERHEHRELLLAHVSADREPEAVARYWTMAGLYQAGVPYLQEALRGPEKDVAPEVRSLAFAIRSPEAAVERFRAPLASGEFDAAWPVLRVLRVVALPDLAPEVCALLGRSSAGSQEAYDALYALTHPVMARAAAPHLVEWFGVEGTVARVIQECRGPNSNAVRNFAGVLIALDVDAVNRALAEARGDPRSMDIASDLTRFLQEFQGEAGVVELFVPGYAADVIDVRHDPLGIQEDVQTLTAVVMAKQISPPLAVGLFGDWGTGKSYFMKSVRAAADAIAERALATGDDTFCTHIVPIEFNAWHYADTHLLASLVNHILEGLAAYVSPTPTTEEQHVTLLSDRANAQAEAEVAEAEKASIQKQIEGFEAALQGLRQEREGREIAWRDLSADDLRNLLSEDPELNKRVEEALRVTGFSGALESVSDLRAAAAEANSAWGRASAWIMSLGSAQNRWIVIVLLLVMLVVIPGVGYVLQQLIDDPIVGTVAAVFAELVAVAGGAVAVLRSATRRVGEHLGTLEEAKRKVDQVLRSKRAQPPVEEVQLAKRVESLRENEVKAAARIAEASARMLALDEEIRSVEEGRSLARFLRERTRSEDYRKHLGVMSTIRQDFESLGERLSAVEAAMPNTRRVERIILYIDDLDRCSAKKVLEVLEAVHLLLAYPLFVVIVGVDPRWLLNSLSDTYSAFHEDGGRAGEHSERWAITPQNYLEKIFQIPFTLRPMTDTGYQNLMDGLMAPAPESRGYFARAGAADDAPQQQEGPDHDGRDQDARDQADQQDQQDQESRIRHDQHRQEEQLARHDQQDGKEQQDGLTRERFVVQKEALVIREWEAEFAKRLFPLMPTPRAAKRFSNVYRMLKAPVGRERLLAFEGTAQHPGEFQLPMLLLALTIGLPEAAAVLFPLLRRNAQQGAGLAEALRRIKSDRRAAGPVETVEDRIGALLHDPRFPDSAEVLGDWVPRVARFSFDLGRARLIAPPSVAGN